MFCGSLGRRACIILQCGETSDLQQREREKQLFRLFKPYKCIHVYALFTFEVDVNNIRMIKFVTNQNVRR